MRKIICCLLAVCLCFGAYGKKAEAAFDSRGAAVMIKKKRKTEEVMLQRRDGSIKTIIYDMTEEEASPSGVKAASASRKDPKLLFVLAGAACMAVSVAWTFDSLRRRY